MANYRRCPNGHDYDADINGDKCPFCMETRIIPDYEARTDATQAAGYPPYRGAGRTQMYDGGFGGYGKTQVVGAGGQVSGGYGGETMIVGGGSEGKTTIRHADGVKMPSHMRRVAGVLVTYDHNPAGDLFRIEEGVNTVGRANTNSVPVTGDNEMSSHHFNITFRPVDNAYFIRDEQSVNGTFVNGQVLPLSTTQLLNPNDVIKAGKTTFVFLAIPKFD